jgi:type 2A phosphatase activator TIP41
VSSPRILTLSAFSSQHHHEGIKEVVKPFDWSYSTDFKGHTHSPDPALVWQPTDQSKHPIRTDLLSRPDPILFYDDVIFYEDELADNGIAIFSCKVRVMAERLLLLCRFFLRLDGVLVRVRDTRIYIELASKTVIRQYTAKEESYDVVQSKLQMHRENIPEVLRDANRIAPLLRTVEDTMDQVTIP